MNTRTMMSWITTLALLLLVATPAMGQEGHRHRMGGQADSARGQQAGMMGQQGGMGHGSMMGHGGMMGMMAPSPAMRMTQPGALLHLSETLELSEEQKSRLEEIREGMQAEHKSHMEAAHSAHMKAREMLEGDAPDMDAYTRQLQSAMDHMARAHASMMKGMVEARGLLTDGQRAQLETTSRIMESMHKMQGMRGGMMKEGMKKDGSGGM